MRASLSQYFVSIAILSIAIPVPQYAQNYIWPAPINYRTVIDEPSFSPWLSNPVGSFNASGRISSLIVEGNVLLSGDWKLSVLRGNITDFKVNFTEVAANGSNRHTHSLGNFEMNVIAPVILDRRGTTFTGESDVTMNDHYAWGGVQITTTILRQEVIKINFNNEGTNNHFYDQPVYGVVDSIQA